MYSLPFLHEHAAMILMLMRMGDHPFKRECDTLRDLCVKWLTCHTAPSDVLEVKFVPPADHPSAASWHNFEFRKKLELPGPTVHHPAVFNAGQINVHIRLNKTAFSLRIVAPEAQAAEQPAFVGIRKLPGLGSVRTGMRSITMPGVTSRPASVMVAADSRSKRPLLAKVTAELGHATAPVVAWAPQANVYNVSSSFQPWGAYSDTASQH